MVSKDAQMDWRGRYSSNEGVGLISTKVQLDILEDLRGGMVSGYLTWYRSITDYNQKLGGQDKQLLSC